MLDSLRKLRAFAVSSVVSTITHFNLPLGKQLVRRRSRGRNMTANPTCSEPGDTGRHHKKWGMIGSKNGGVAQENVPDRWMTLEFPVQEMAHP